MIEQLDDSSATSLAAGDPPPATSAPPDWPPGWYSLEERDHDPDHRSSVGGLASLRSSVLRACMAQDEPGFLARLEQGLRTPQHQFQAMNLVWPPIRSTSLRQPLIDCLASSSAHERVDACAALARLCVDIDGSPLRGTAPAGNQPDPVIPLIARLDDPNDGVREAAALALGDIGDSRAFRPLVDLLEPGPRGRRRSPEPAVLVTVRAAAARALGALNDPRAAAPLLDVLERQSEVARKRGSSRPSGLDPMRLQRDLMRLKAAAAWALVRLHVPDLDQVLTACLERALAANEHGAQGPQPQGRDRSPRGLHVLESGVYSSGWPAALVEGLGRLGSNAGVDSLIAALGHSDTYTRLVAAESLGRTGSSAAVEPLVHALEDESPSVQYQAAKALAVFQDERATPKLADALARYGDPLSWTMPDLNEARRRLDLAHRPDSEFVDALHEVGKERHAARAATKLPAVCLMAANALVEIDSPDSRRALIDALRERASGLAASVAAVLILRRTPAALDILLDAVAEQRSTNDLGRPEGLTTTSDAPPVERAYDDDLVARTIPGAALIGLGVVCVEHLGSTLGDRDPGRRWAAAGVLGQIQDERASRTLRAALVDRRWGPETHRAADAPEPRSSTHGEAGTHSRELPLAQLENAIVLSTYDLGPYEVRMLIDAEPLWPSFRYFLAVLEPGTAEPLVLVTADKQEDAAEGRLQISVEGRTTDLVWVAELEDADEFGSQALELARSRLGVTDEPAERVRDRRTGGSHEDGPHATAIAGPQASNARLVARYSLGPYEAHLFTDIETALGEIAYTHVLAIYDEKDEARLFVAAEEGLLGSRVLGVFDEDGHKSHVWDPSWEALEPFAEHAWKLSANLLNLQDDPGPLPDEPPAI